MPGERGGKPSSGRPNSGRSSGGDAKGRRSAPGRLSAGKGSTGRSNAGTGAAKGGKPAGRGDGSRSRVDRGAPRGHRDHSEQRSPRTAEQAKYDGPELDPAITGKELDGQVLAQLKGLPEKLAARVARHLAAAGLLIDTDPRAAYEHTLAARARAARVAVVREACGEAAYAAGEFAEALSELRAARRMNGANDYLPMMADCERALGRPEKALTLARNDAVGHLPLDLQAEMTIVEAGARADLGELDGALRVLENAPLRSRSRADWVARLRYAYADLLVRAGRTDEGVEWFHRTVGVDGNGVTDAEERLLELSGE